MRAPILSESQHSDITPQELPVSLLPALSRYRCHEHSALPATTPNNQTTQVSSIVMTATKSGHQNTLRETRLPLQYTQFT